MRALFTMVALLLSAPALPDGDVFSFGNCQRLSPETQERLRAIDLALTEKAALAAEREVRRRVAARLTEPARPGPTSRALAVTLEGWMTKKAWLAARARREHDADEAGEYCAFLRREAGLDVSAGDW